MHDSTLPHRSESKLNYIINFLNSKVKKMDTYIYIKKN